MLGCHSLSWHAFHLCPCLCSHHPPQWFRDGKELAPLGERRQYSFDYQVSSRQAASRQTATSPLRPISLATGK